MGSHGLCCDVRGRRRVAAPGGRGSRVLFVASMALMPAFAGCSADYSGDSLRQSYVNLLQTLGNSPTTVPTAAPPPQNAAAVPAAPANAAGAAPPAATAAATRAAPPQDDQPTGLLVDLFKLGSTPSAQPAPVPHPPSTYTPSASPVAAGTYAAPAPQPAVASTYAPSTPPASAGPVSARGGTAAAAVGTSGPGADDGPSGLLVDLYRYNTARSAPAANAQPGARAGVPASAPPPSTDTAAVSPAGAGPVNARGGTAATSAGLSGPSADDSGPHGLLVDLFGSKSSQPAPVPHPPSTYTPSAPPYTPSQGQTGAAPGQQ